MDENTFRVLQSILRKDSTDTTYKYALLRALIEIADEYEHQIIDITSNEVVFPFGLVIEKWLYYYYPIIEAGLPQRNGANPNDPLARTIAFRSEFEQLIERYEGQNGYHTFVRDYRAARLKGDDQLLIDLIKKLKRTIADYPMKHLGFSHFREHYKVVYPHRDWKRLTSSVLQSPVDSEFLIRNMGCFSIGRHFYDIFQLLGGFINGTDAVLYQWAKFTAKAVDDLGVSVNSALQALVESPEVKRNVTLARKTFENSANINSLSCVWSGRRLDMGNLAIDHVIPFSLWGNNDLWNLLPSHTQINGRKGDKIPKPDFIYECRDGIAEYWSILRAGSTDVFSREMRVSLTGANMSGSDEHWLEIGLDALTKKCDYLIKVRGFESWSL